MKITKRQKELLLIINNREIFRQTGEVPLRRVTKEFYTDYTFSNSTYRKLADSGLIYFEVIKSGFGSSTAKVKLTDAGINVLENIKNK